MKHLVICALLPFLTSPAHGALELLIYEGNETFSWNDSGTIAPDITIPQSQVTTFFLCNQILAAPLPGSASAVDGSGDSLYFFNNRLLIDGEETLTLMSPGLTRVDAVEGVISIQLGGFYADMSSPTLGFNASLANSNGGSFAGFTPAEKAFLYSLGGTTMYFLRSSGGVSSVIPTDGNALEITVIGVPEPSATGLLALGVGSLLVRRRRGKVVTR